MYEEQFKTMAEVYNGHYSFSAKMNLSFPGNKPKEPTSIRVHLKYNKIWNAIQRKIFLSV